VPLHFPGIYPTTFRIDLYSLTTSKPATVAVPSSARSVVNILNNVVFQLHQDLLFQRVPLLTSKSNGLDGKACFDRILKYFELGTHYLINKKLLSSMASYYVSY
jgi:hypothetical protein